MKEYAIQVAGVLSASIRTGFFPGRIFPVSFFPRFFPQGLGARHYLHFGEIIGHGERASFDVRHWLG